MLHSPACAPWGGLQPQHHAAGRSSATPHPALVCRRHAQPSLTQRPHAQRSSFTRLAPAHPSRHASMSGCPRLHPTMPAARPHARMPSFGSHTPARPSHAPVRPRFQATRLPVFTRCPPVLVFRPRARPSLTRRRSTHTIVRWAGELAMTMGNSMPCISQYFNSSINYKFNLCRFIILAASNGSAVETRRFPSLID